MLDSVIAAGLGAIVAAAAGSLIISSDRLRQAASADADLLTTLRAENKAIAKTVSFSMARAAAVAAIRSIHPALTLSEAVALAASLVGMPVYVALLDYTYPDRLGFILGSLVSVVLVALYAATTYEWCRRAYARVGRYRDSGLPEDANEAARQTKIALAAQGAVAGFSFLVTCMMLGTLINAARWGDLALAGVAVCTAAVTSGFARRKAEAAAPERPTKPESDLEEESDPAG